MGRGQVAEAPGWLGQTRLAMTLCSLPGQSRTVGPSMSMPATAAPAQCLLQRILSGPFCLLAAQPRARTKQSRHLGPRFQGCAGSTLRVRVSLNFAPWAPCLPHHSADSAYWGEGLGEII